MATVNSTYTDPNSATLDKATGGTIDETMTDAWSSNWRHTHGSVGYIGCRATSSADLSISTGTLTALALNTEAFDSDPNGAMHDTVTNNSRMTCQTAGVFGVTTSLRFAAHSTGYRQAILRVNGSALAATMTVAAVASPDITDLCVSTHYLFAVGDYVEVVVQQTSGGSLNVVAGCVLTMMKM